LSSHKKRTINSSSLLIFGQTINAHSSSSHTYGFSPSQFHHQHHSHKAIFYTNTYHQQPPSIDIPSSTVSSPHQQ
jgi:hypothetical protein